MRFEASRQPQVWESETAEVHAWHLSLWGRWKEGSGWSIREGGVGLDDVRYEERGHAWGHYPAG